MTASPEPSAAPTRPSKPRLVLRVGVTGHRTQPLTAMGVDLGQLRQTLGDIFTQLRDTVEAIRSANGGLFDDTKATELRLISALASGADSLAVEALPADPPGKPAYRVTAVLPFPEDVYELDFTEKVGKRTDELKLLPDADPKRAKVAAELVAAEADAERYAALRATADIARVELDGDRTNDATREEAYAAVGQLVVNHSDVLIAVWNKETTPNRGGTWRVAKEALRLGIPVIHVRPVGGPPTASLETTVQIGPDDLHLKKMPLAEYLGDEFTRLLLPPDLWPVEPERPAATEAEAKAAEEARHAAAERRKRERGLRREYHAESYRKWIRGPFKPPEADRSAVGRALAWVVSGAIGLLTFWIGGFAKMGRSRINGQLSRRVTKARDAAAKKALEQFPGTTTKMRLKRWRVRRRAVLVEYGKWVYDCATVKDPWEEWEKGWNEEWAGAAGNNPDVFRAVRAAADAEVKEHRCWAEMLAQYYANLYRSAATLIYLFAALAVAAALVPLFFHFVLHVAGDPNGAWIPHEVEGIWLGAELLFITYILILLGAGRWGRWHERYIDYRLIAENLRILRHQLPLGRTTQFARVPAHDQAGDPGSTWALWHFRAVLRAAGLVPGRFNAQSVVASARLWQAYTRKQEEYHRGTWNGLKNLLRWLKRVEYALFIVTFLACVTHLVIHFGFPEWKPGSRVGAALTLLAALLPAIGAALFAWVQFLDAETVEKREEAMTDRLSRHRADFDTFLKDVQKGEPATRAVLSPVVDQVAQVMSDEALDWRVHFAGQVLTTPP